MSSERENIAARLRYIASDSLDGKSLQRALAETTGAGDGSWRGVMRRLADLIDPTWTCEMQTLNDFGGDVVASICSACGAVIRGDELPSYCPNCGTRVVGSDE